MNIERLVVGCWLLGAAACGGGAPGGSAGAEDPSGAAGEAASAGAGEGGDTAESAKAAESSLPAPKQGVRGVESRHFALKFELTLTKNGSAAGIQSGSWSVDEERFLSVVGVKGKNIEKLGVRFGKQESKKLLGWDPNIVTIGKDYVLDAGSGSLMLQTSEGKETTPPERAAVTLEYGWVGEGSPLRRWLAGAKAGASVSGGAAEARALLGAVPGLKHEGTELSGKVEENDGKRARVALSAKTELSTDITHFALEVGGTASVDLATGLVTQLSMKGPLTISGKVHHAKGELDAKGKGNVEIERKLDLGA